MESTPQGGVPGVPRDALSASILGTSCECHKMRRGIMRARQEVRVPTRCPRSEYSLLKRIATSKCDQFYFSIEHLDLCSVSSAVRDALSGQSSELSAAKAGKVLTSARRSLGNQAEQEGVLHLGLRGKDNKKHSQKRVLFSELQLTMLFAKLCGFYLCNK